MPILPDQLTPAPDSPATVSRWSVPFQTLEEVRAYLAGDSITCLVCGAVMHKLPKHLKDIHGMTSDDYRCRFGIPFGRSLTSATARDRMRQSISPEKAAKFRAAAEAQRANRASRKGLPRTTRGVIPAVQNHSKMAAAKLHKNPSDSDAPQVQPQAFEPTYLAPPLPAPTQTFRFIGKEAIVDRQFQTMQEVEDYLSGPDIMCLICGRRFQRLNRHVQHAHDIRPDEYKFEFGIPYSRGLVSLPSGAKTTAANKRPERIAQITQLGKGTRKTQKPPRPNVPAVRDLMQNLWKKMCESGRLFTREYVTIPCTKCGREVVTTRLCALQTVTCLDCTTPGSRKSRLYYWRSKRAA
jgi:predicted transcriptional regulator